MTSQGATRRPNIITRTDIEPLVLDFCGRAVDDAVLGPIFIDVAHRDLTEHLLRWLEIWTATVDDHFAGPRAEFAKEQARRIAYSMGRRVLGEDAEDFIVIKRPDLPLGFTPRP